MLNMSDNYYLREFYIENDQVPTQSVMKKKMTPNLADLVFKSMTPKQKILAGIEPALQGGGSDWYIPPKDVLEEGRAVKRPLQHAHLIKLSHHGIIHFGMETIIAHGSNMAEETNKMRLESDAIWKTNVKKSIDRCWQETVKMHTKMNTENINKALESLSNIYGTSLNKIEEILREAAVKKIKNTQEEAVLKMHNLYKTLLKSQVAQLTVEFREKLIQEKARLKDKFTEQLQICRTQMGNRIHDLNVDKHKAIEKIGTILECQNLACQIYVSMKEREECMKEIETSNRRFNCKDKDMTEVSTFQDIEIHLAEQRERKRQELNSIWLKKICRVVKNFQMFVSYCLHTLPDHAEFFINMEKLMLLQINEALEEPTAESIIIAEEDKFHTPVPKPKPFYLFCDRGYKHDVDEDLCPKHSTSTTSQLPVIIVNKRCLYAACDNFDQITDKVKDFIQGNREDDDDIKDELIYEHYVPVKYTSSQQLLELKLESSLLQVLQQEMANIRDVPFESATCKTSSTRDVDKPCDTIRKTIPSKPPEISLTNNRTGTKTSITRLEHERKPNMEGYLKSIEPKKCGCAKRAKKHLEEHLPVYMRNISAYEPLELPNYETCPVTTLKTLVKHARGQINPPVIATKLKSETKDVSTQYSDHEFDRLCTCFSDTNADILERDPIAGSKLFQSNVSHSSQFCIDPGSAQYMTKQPSSFAIDRAHSLKRLINDSPELLEIFFKTKNC